PPEYRAVKGVYLLAELVAQRASGKRELHVVEPHAANCRSGLRPSAHPFAGLSRDAHTPSGVPECPANRLDASVPYRRDGRAISSVSLVAVMHAEPALPSC